MPAGKIAYNKIVKRQGERHYKARDDSCRYRGKYLLEKGLKRGTAQVERRVG